MRVLIDIGHPAHVHLFKNFTHAFIEKGHSVHFTVRLKENETDLLDKEGFDYTVIGYHNNTFLGKVLGAIKFTFNIIFASIRFKPDLFLSHGSMYAAWASFLWGKPNIALEDTGNKEQVRLYLPFTKAILSPSCLKTNYSNNHIKYYGFHEIAYLHPKYFKQDKSILDELGLKENQSYFILRLVSWQASHDKGNYGLISAEIHQLIELLLQYGKVFISTESTADSSLNKFKFPLSSDRMHQALAQARLVVSEGATVASECAMLGTPVVFINSIFVDTIESQAKDHLLYHLKDSREMIPLVNRLIMDNDLKQKAMHARDLLLAGTIDVTCLLVWFVENWPKSMNQIQEKPNFQ